MGEPASAALWYRVAPLRARLRDHAQIHRHHYRGKLWYVLQDGASTRFHRFGPGAHQLLRLMDGERTVGEVWEAVDEALGDEAPTQDEVIKLLSSLSAGDLLRCDVDTDPKALFSRQDRARRSKWTRPLKSPLFIRVPLFDPDRLLERWTPAARWAFAPLSLALWLVCVTAAAIVAGTYWPELKAYWADRALAPHNLLLICLAYPVVKGLHELAHGLATKRWGGEVHESGIMFLLFMPLPYMNASAASAFSDKRKRMLVGAAGIMAELLLAAIALAVWFNVETGMVRDLAYDVLIIGGISTVLFNGNPLLRFDGYYVLADAIEIPNLAQRSTQYYRYLAERYLFGVRTAVTPVTAPGERGWFLSYGLASPAYRLLILAAIVMFVADHHLLAGVLVGILMVGGQVAHPIAKQIGYLMGSPALRGRRARAVGVVAMLGAVLVAALGLAPVPTYTFAEGVVWLPERAQVRAGADGFITRTLVDNNTFVEAGEPLFEIEDPLADALVRTRAWELREAEARYRAAFLVDRAGAEMLKSDIERARADLEQVRQDAARLTVTSTEAGVLVVPRANELTGRFVRKGDVLGYVTERSRPSLRVVVSQGDAGLVRDQTRAVNLRLADRASEPLRGEVVRSIPSATARLPSRALGTPGGGLVAIDPDDAEGLTALEPVFLFEVELLGETRPLRVGTRAYLRFEHDAATVAEQGFRALRQLFLRRFAV